MVLQSTGAISMSQIVTEFGGAAPHAMSEYYSDYVLGYTLNANGVIPATGSAFAMSSMYGKSRATTYTLQHPDGRTVLWDTRSARGYTLCLNAASGFTEPLSFSIYNNANVYANSSNVVGLLHTNSLVYAVRCATGSGGYMYIPPASAYVNSSNVHAFMFRRETIGGTFTGRYYIMMFGDTVTFYLGYSVGNDALTMYATLGSALSWFVSPAPSPLGPDVAL